MQKLRTKPEIRLKKMGMGAAIIATLAGLATAAPANPADDYLRAWSFKDYPTMYSMLRPQDRPSSEEAFAAAAAQSAPSEVPQIVQKKTSGSIQLIYFHYADSQDHQGQNSSIEVFPDGIRHSDVTARIAGRKPIELAPDSAGRAANPSQALPAAGPALNSNLNVNGTSNAGTSAISPSGLQGGQILQKMEQATAAVKNFSVQISMQGTIMGQNINEAGTLAFMAPDNFKMATKMFVVNGHHGQTTLYMPQMQTQMDISSAMAGDFAPGLPGLPGGTGGKQAELLETTTENGVPVYKLKVPDTSNATGGSMLSQLGGGAMQSPTIMTVNGQTWLPMHAEKSGVTVTYTGYQFNRTDITDATFQVKTPSGTQTLSMDTLMGMK